MGYTTEFYGAIDLRIIGSKVEGFDASHWEDQASPGPGFASVEETTPLKRVLRRKAGHGYELEDKPFVVAALCAGEFIDDRDIAMALLGEIRYGVGGGTAGSYIGSGLWLDKRCRPRNKGVSAVLTAIDLRPQSCAFAEPCLWVNPWARHAVPAEALPWRRMEIQRDGRIIERPATHSAADIFGLDPHWPAVG